MQLVRVVQPKAAAPAAILIDFRDYLHVDARSGYDWIDLDTTDVTGRACRSVPREISGLVCEQIASVQSGGDPR